jgi:iron(III) transport system ATP-binding protein
VILEAQNISLSFGRPILKAISLKLKEGEIISIVGRSGAGKTSLLKILAGLLTPDTGSVLFDGERIKGPNERLIPGHDEIYLVNQDFSLDDFHTVEENIRLQILHLKLKVRDRFTDELISLMGLEDVRKQQARSLSGGEQQRLAIARVLAKEPRVILLDEPFSHLDSDLRTRLTSYLLELRRVRGTSFVLVSHDGAEVLGLSDSIFFMKNGVLTKKGDPKKVYYRYGTLQEARLFGPVNSVKIGNERILFRPDEYTLLEVAGAPKLKLQFIEVSFTGPVYENYFLTENQEKIVLFSFTSLEEINVVYIAKKSS